MVSENDFEEFLDVRTVAQLLKVRQHTVQRWLRKGYLRGVRVSRFWRIPRSEVERVMREGVEIRRKEGNDANAS